jgi:hypothetical protein
MNIVELRPHIEARRRARRQEIVRAELEAAPDLTWATWLLDVALGSLGADERARVREALEGRDMKHRLADGPRSAEAIVARSLLYAALTHEQRLRFE